MQKSVPAAAIKDAAARPSRPPQDNVPQTKAERDRLLRVVREYMAAQSAVPPLSMDELWVHSGHTVGLAEVDPKYRKFIAVLVGNAAWREALASVPFDRRLLLLPQCLRAQGRCSAAIDDFGLVCNHCGLCPIHDLTTEAERLGYVVLCAEGTTVVTSLFESGKIQAVVGISCLSTLERVFPYIEAAACPGIAIPLLQDGCADTSVDLDWVWDAVLLTSEDKTRRLDLDALRAEVDSWFTPASLGSIMGVPRTETEALAQEWLARSGKRWRPFLAVCAYQAFQEDTEAPLPADLRRIAVAVECFHKASLVHDDIEDHDEKRYGEQTLHKAYGVPIALNVGDLLVGEGYRMLAELDASAGVRAAMVRAAASGHRSLCIGQGEELSWMRKPRPLSPAQVLGIFRQKTSPAFEVSLRLGLIYAGVHDDLWETVDDYSEALGLAYQIRDDLADFRLEAAGEDGKAISPSLLLAIAHERAGGEAKAFLDSLWRRPGQLRSCLDEVDRVFADLGVDETALRLLESYKERAIRSLCRLDNANLKGLLRRVISKIFNGIETKGSFSDAEARDAAGRKPGAQASS